MEQELKLVDWKYGENVEDASSLVKLMEHTYKCNNNAIRISSVYHLMAEIYNMLTIVTLISKNVLAFIHFIVHIFFILLQFCLNC